jgi:hypothetical protein
MLVLKFCIAATLVLQVNLVAHAAGVSNIFCPQSNKFPNHGNFAVYGKEVDGISYVIAVTTVDTLTLMRGKSTDIQLEARRKIISFVESRTVSSSERFSAVYHFNGIETHRLNCYGHRLVLFVQDRSRIEKLNQGLDPNNNITPSNLPDPNKSAEDNLMEVIKNKH